MNKEVPVLILGSHYNALSMTQILGKSGIKCYVISYTKGAAGRSKYGVYVKSPDPLKNPEAFISFLENYCTTFSKAPVVIPSMDQWALVLSKCKVENKVVDHTANLELLLNKDQFYAFGEKEGYAVPKSFSLNAVNQIPSEAYPLVVKPNFRLEPGKNAEEIEDFSEEINKYRLKQFDTPQELKRFISDEKNKNIVPHLILQEFVTGNSDCMFTYGIYAEEGKVLGDFQGRKVRGYPHGYGDCIVGERHDLPEKVVTEAKRLIEQLKYTGIAEVEYKKDEQTGIFKLIEINPRSWSWVGITQFTEHNLPILAYLSMTKQSLPSKNPNNKEGKVVFKKVIEDRFNSLYRYKKTYPAWSKNITTWKKEFSNSFVYKAEFSHSDYFQWVYSFLKINAILYIKWFILKRKN